MSSFGLENNEYSKLKYADLLIDLERILGVDSTLLGLDKVDFEYDERMRYWVGRQHEHYPIKAPDPREPLLDLDNISFDRIPAETTQQENYLAESAQP